MPPPPAELRDFALSLAPELGFDLAGVAGVAPSPHLTGFAAWIAAGHAGDMQYLSRRGPDGRYLREDIRTVWPWARSLLCGGTIYHTAHPRSTEPPDPTRGWISRYAWGSDYHDTLRERLQAWAERLHAFAQSRSPAEPGADPAQFHCVVDTAPLIERDAAARAGLGWQGKNTCLIHPRAGSYFFLGVVLTSLDLSHDTPLPDRCGSCTRCIEACPTQALTPYAMDASRCLAYLNIEQRGSIPEAYRSAMGNNVLGCDICQDVCPWNRRAPASSDPTFQPRSGLVAPSLAELASLTEDDYRQRFRKSAVKRAKYAGLRRNIAVAMGNSGNPVFRQQLQLWTEADDAVLAEHARWALAQLGPATDPGDDGPPA